MCVCVCVWLSRFGRGGGGGGGRDVSLYKTYRQWELTYCVTNELNQVLGSTKVVYLGWQRRILTEVCSLAWCVCVFVCEGEMTHPRMKRYMCSFTYLL